MAVSFVEKISTLVKLIKEPGILSSLLSLRYSGYLADNGWFASFNKKAPLDKNGNPIPWFTYSCNDFIKGRLKKNFNIFEFGSGNSTLFFAPCVNSVTSVEHNEEWFRIQKNRIPSNVKIIFDDDNTGGYSRSISNSNNKYEIVVVDGIDRVNCIINSVDYLSENGVLLLDDSERNEYGKGIEFLNERGFKKIDFWGIAAGILFKKCTSIFYKDRNCLEI